jgi:glucan endo-1,3-alpha-glucosidase
MGFSMWTALYGLAIASIATPALSTRQHDEHHHHTRRATATTPMVFAHYMISYQPPKLDYSNDINLAKAAGIDAFAVNYGGWGNAFADFANYLDVFYKTAEHMDFKLFICFDLTSVTDKNMVTNLTNHYSKSTAQAKDPAGNIFLSSFQKGPAPFNWQKDIIANIGVPVTLLPGTLSEDGPYTAGAKEGFGPFTWVHPACDATEEQAVDTSFANERNSNGAPWMAGVAPWFFKRMDTTMNWLHAQDSAIWLDRWMHLLKVKPNYIEIVTWNGNYTCQSSNPQSR